LNVLRIMNSGKRFWVVVSVLVSLFAVAAMVTTKRPDCWELVLAETSGACCMLIAAWVFAFLTVHLFVFLVGLSKSPKFIAICVVYSGLAFLAAFKYD
jgi:hypothetical protein